MFGGGVGGIQGSWNKRMDMVRLYLLLLLLFPSLFCVQLAVIPLLFIISAPMVDLVEWVGLAQAQRTHRNSTPWDLIIQAITALMTETIKVLMADEAAIVV
jgi:hypothetical protein